MAEKAMGVPEVLSVLGQIELDLTQLIAQKRGIARIREVLTVYQESAKVMVEMEETKKGLTKDIQALQVEYSNKRDAEHRVFDAKKEHYAKECDTANAELADVCEKLKAAQDELAERERFAVEQSARLDGELKTKSAQLAQLTKALDDFKKKLDITG